jgi:hypothetical protein
LRGSLRNLGDHLLVGEADRLRQWFDPLALRSLWESHQAREANHGFALWGLLTFALWREQME